MSPNSTQGFLKAKLSATFLSSVAPDTTQKKTNMSMYGYSMRKPWVVVIQ